ncbi:LacI family DNA-binding transcriptional regulator [Cellulomonas sp. NPDC089187]|uniref:LacI family DNA-binding transcriptional regulator n=1 Tax=Cellulomonas sp. NPDC089187 TaxID=3154970 RepID=UPI0034425B01
MPRPVTLSDVAREAGVSLATASRALNGSATRTVGPELARRVRAAADKLRYAPDGVAQAMARGRTNAIGLVVADVSDPLFGAITSGVSAAADEAGLSVTLASTREVPGREATVIDALARQRVRAMVLVGAATGNQEADMASLRALESYLAAGGSAALIGASMPGTSGVDVADHRSASRLALELHALGYRRFVVLAGPERPGRGAERLAGFVETLAVVGGEVVTVQRMPEPTREAGEQAMAEVLASGVLSAEAGAGVPLVFAITDQAAFGAMAVLRRAGVSVPEQVAVAGFDDNPGAAEVTPSLTTVRLPLVEAGREAVALSLAGEVGRTVVLDGELMVRDSTPAVGSPE